MTSKAKPCMDCGRLPKELPRRFCRWCWLKRQPMHVQAEAAKVRREAIPEDLRLKRSQKIVKDDTPPGLSFCAGCQSYCPDWMFAKNSTQCRPCASAKAHAARTEKVYGIDSTEYERILEVQGGVCAISRTEFRSIRGVVDHDHTTGAVRGILNTRINHELLGAAHDDAEILWRAYVYLRHPPASDDVESWEQLMALNEPPEIVVAKPRELPAFTLPGKGRSKPKEKVDRTREEYCDRGVHYLPVGSDSIPGKKGVWRYLVSDEPDSDHPF